MYFCFFPARKDKSTNPTKTITKEEIVEAVAPYKYTGSGSKGTPNCP